MSPRGVAVVLLLIAVMTAGCSVPFLGSDPGPKYNASTDTGDIVLRLSDVPEAYDRGGESLQYRSNLSGSEKRQFSRQGIIKQHQRSFLLNDSSNQSYPAVLISAAVVYEDTASADENIRNTIANLTSEGASYRKMEIVTGVNATIAQFENDRGGHVTVIYDQDSNMGYYVVALADQPEIPELVKEMFVKMIIDL